MHHYRCRCRVTTGKLFVRQWLGGFVETCRRRIIDADAVRGGTKLSSSGGKGSEIACLAGFKEDCEAGWHREMMLCWEGGLTL